jgi:hypothetical protein
MAGLNRGQMKTFEKKLGRHIDHLAGKAKSANHEASAKAHEVTKGATDKARGLARKTGAKMQNAGKKIKSLLG